MVVTRGELSVPKHLGLVSELERADSAVETEVNAYFYAYGPGEREVFVDDIAIQTASDELSTIDTYHDFDSFERLFAVETNGQRVLTNQPPEDFEYETEQTHHIEVAIEDSWGNEYVKLDGDWYAGADAGNLYMHHRRDNISPMDGAPPDSADRMTVTLYDPHSGGGTFWAMCSGVVGSGDMPKEAITAVTHA